MYAIRTYLLSCLLLWPTVSLFGQNEQDALLHSLYSSTGSARSLGMAGAFSAVGADLSSATLNPAGLGFYRRSEFGITPAFRLANNEAEFLGTINSASKTNFGIGSWGFAFFNQVYRDDGRKREEVEKGLKSYTLAFGQNQLDNYYREVRASGYNEFSSITDMFAERASGRFADQLLGDPNSLEGLAFTVFAIDTLAGSINQYFPAFNNGRIDQNMQMIETGRNNEWFIAFGGNVSDRIYFGLSMGVQSIRYSQQFIFQENDVNNLHRFYQNNPLNPSFPLEFPAASLEYEDEFSTAGNGINGRFGLIYRPVDALRVGISVQTPTFLSLTDEFYSRIRLEGDPGIFDGAQQQETERGQFDYRLRTPYRATLGLMYLFGKQGFISADVDLTDYTAARLSTNVPINSPAFYDFQSENAAIQRSYKQAVNVRLGGELRADAFRFRAGAGYFGSPFSDAGSAYIPFDRFGGAVTATENLDASRLIFSLGAGLRQPNYYLDVTLMNQRRKDKFSPYVTESQQVFNPNVISTRSTFILATSLGFFF